MTPTPSPEPCELKPCPFCGSSADVTPSGRIAFCTNADCDATITMQTCIPEVVAAAWNRRAEESSLREALLIAEKALITLCDGMDHDDENCPEDDTCECENIREINMVFAAIRARTKGE